MKLSNLITHRPLAPFFGGGNRGRLGLWCEGALAQTVRPREHDARRLDVERVRHNPCTSAELDRPAEASSAVDRLDGNFVDRGLNSGSLVLCIQQAPGWHQRYLERVCRGMTAYATTQHSTAHSAKNNNHTHTISVHTQLNQKRLTYSSLMRELQHPAANRGFGRQVSAGQVTHLAEIRDGVT